MKVIVTGSAGFIGQHVMAELAARGHEGVPFDRPHDVTQAADVHAACDGAGAVIHLAGMLGTSELMRGMHEAVRINVLGALNVYECASIRNIPVVQIGTGHKGQPNTYAITKACAEDLGLARAQWLGEKIAVVRAFHVYGPGQKPPAPWGRSPVRKFFPTFACQALSGQPLEVYGSGEQIIDPVHVSEVARVLVDAMDGPYGVVTEAGCGKPVTVGEISLLMQMFAAERGCPPPGAKSVPMRPGEPENTEVLAREPACRNPWPYKVAETLDWYRQFTEVR